MDTPHLNKALWKGLSPPQKHGEDGGSHMFAGPSPCQMPCVCPDWVAGPATQGLGQWPGVLAEWAAGSRASWARWLSTRMHIDRCGCYFWGRAVWRNQVKD